jgi:hypothetical protein
LEEHKKDQSVSESDVIKSFEIYFQECQPGGCRFDNYLIAFAGKDLMQAIDQWLSDNGFIGAWAFREKLLVGISKTQEDIAEWLPEWKLLRESITTLP